MATLTSARGAVQTKARGARAWTTVKGTRPLSEGTAIRVGKGGKALLLQPGCPPRALREGEAVVVSASKKWLSGVGTRPMTAGEHRSLLQLLASAARSHRSQPTGIRPEELELELALSPRSERVLDGRPRFVWRDLGPDSQYEIEVYQGDALLWEAKTQAAELPYPPDRAPLKPGRYQWQIYARTLTGKQAADGATFTVTERSTAEKIRAEVAAAQALVPGESTLNLPLISLYVKHQLYTPAETALQQALKLTPEDGELRRLLAHVYSLQGKTQARTELLSGAAR